MPTRTEIPPSPAGKTHAREADNARDQPTDDLTDRAAPTDGTPLGSAPAPAGSAPDIAQRADRGSRDADAARRGAPPGAASSDT